MRWEIYILLKEVFALQFSQQLLTLETGGLVQVVRNGCVYLVILFPGWGGVRRTAREEARPQH